MTTVRYVGDIHGQYGRYYRTIETVNTSVQVGDYGIGFGPVPQGLQDLGSGHRFIRGNHDWPDGCKQFPNYIADGTVETINGTKVMYIGGARSIDVAYRIEGVSWWPDEELSYRQFENMFAKYEEHKPDVMITHELPESMVIPVFSTNNYNFTKLGIGSITRNAFDTMLSIHSPKVWIFGHWHQHADVTIHGTRYVCLDCHQYADVSYPDLDMQFGYWEQQYTDMLKNEE